MILVGYSNIFIVIARTSEDKSVGGQMEITPEKWKYHVVYYSFMFQNKISKDVYIQKRKLN